MNSFELKNCPLSILFCEKLENMQLRGSVHTRTRGKKSPAIVQSLSTKRRGKRTSTAKKTPERKSITSTILGELISESVIQTSEKLIISKNTLNSGIFNTVITKRKHAKQENASMLYNCISTDIKQCHVLLERCDVNLASKINLADIKQCYVLLEQCDVNVASKVNLNNSDISERNSISRKGNTQGKKTRSPQNKQRKPLSNKKNSISENTKTNSKKSLRLSKSLGQENGETLNNFPVTSTPNKPSHKVNACDIVGKKTRSSQNKQRKPLSNKKNSIAENTETNSKKSLRLSKLRPSFGQENGETLNNFPVTSTPNKPSHKVYACDIVGMIAEKKRQTLHNDKSPSSVSSNASKFGKQTNSSSPTKNLRSRKRTLINISASSPNLNLPTRKSKRKKESVIQTPVSIFKSRNTEFVFPASPILKDRNESANLLKTPVNLPKSKCDDFRSPSSLMVELQRKKNFSKQKSSDIMKSKTSNFAPLELPVQKKKSTSQMGTNPIKHKSFGDITYLKDPIMTVIHRHRKAKSEGFKFPTKNSLKRKRYIVNELRKFDENHEDDIFENQNFDQYQAMLADITVDFDKSYDSVETPKPAFSLTPVPCRSTPKYKDTLSPSELALNRKIAEECMYRRNKRKKKSSNVSDVTPKAIDPEKKKLEFSQVLGNAFNKEKEIEEIMNDTSVMDDSYFSFC